MKGARHGPRGPWVLVSPLRPCVERCVLCSAVLLESRYVTSIRLSKLGMWLHPPRWRPCVRSLTFPCLSVHPSDSVSLLLPLKCFFVFSLLTDTPLQPAPIGLPASGCVSSTAGTPAHTWAHLSCVTLGQDPPSPLRWCPPASAAPTSPQCPGPLFLMDLRVLNPSRACSLQAFPCSSCLPCSDPLSLMDLGLGPEPLQQLHGPWSSGLTAVVVGASAAPCPESSFFSPTAGSALGISLSAGVGGGETQSPVLEGRDATPLLRVLGPKTPLLNLPSSAHASWAA